MFYFFHNLLGNTLCRRYELPEMPASYYSAPKPGLPSDAIKEELQSQDAELAAPPDLEMGSQACVQQPEVQHLVQQPAAAAQMPLPHYQPLQPERRTKKESRSLMAGRGANMDESFPFPPGTVPKRRRIQHTRPRLLSVTLNT